MSLFAMESLRGSAVYVSTPLHKQLNTLLIIKTLHALYPHIPAQIGKGLEIQLLHLLLAEPVADSPAFQEGLHLHCAPVPALEVNGVTGGSTCTGETTGSHTMTLT